MDRRETPWNGRVAHVSLKGKVEAERFVEGDYLTSINIRVPISDSPGGALQRELNFGERFCVLDEDGDLAFGFSERDGYVGWIDTKLFSLRDVPSATHVVQVPMTHGLQSPDIKDNRFTYTLSMGARLSVAEKDGRWAKVTTTAPIFVPEIHIRPIRTPETDPVAVAERLLGTPYLWGGNSAFGIDCSGLVQIACLACGIPCPGDSDQQEARLGHCVPNGTPPERGDLLFWRGHVAWVADESCILHANAHSMSVTFEDRKTAIARIMAQGDGPVTGHKRLG